MCVCACSSFFAFHTNVPLFFSFLLLLLLLLFFFYVRLLGFSKKYLDYSFEVVTTPYFFVCREIPTRIRITRFREPGSIA